jgi:hypothetical protein
MLCAKAPVAAQIANIENHVFILVLCKIVTVFILDGFRKMCYVYGKGTGNIFSTLKTNTRYKLLI